MARVAIVFGLLLCGLTLYGLSASMLKSPLQFIPLMFGIPVFLCGIVGLNPHRRRLSSLVAALITGLGAVIGSVAMTRLVFEQSDRPVPKPLLATLGILMTIICVIFVLAYLVNWYQQRSRRPGNSLGKPTAGVIGKSN